MKEKGEGAQIPYEYSNASSYVSSHSGRAPYFDGTHYAVWKHKMKIHLKSINPSIQCIVGNDYTVQDPNKPTPEDDQNKHKNAQTANVIFSALSGDEFNRVKGIESAK